MMVLTMAQLDAYYAACAPHVGRSTIAAIVQVESGGAPWAIHDNTSKRRWHARNYREAVAIGNALVRLGHSVDMGLAQVNSRNLARVRMSVAEVFEPCRNLIAAATILEDCYAPAATKYGAAQRALVHALGCYNTGSLYAGRRYVARVLEAAEAPRGVLNLARVEFGTSTLRARISSWPLVTWKANTDWRVRW